MTRFQMGVKTPAEWIEFAMGAPVSEEARKTFLAGIVEDAYKSGFRAGMKHDPAAPMPWDVSSTVTSQTRGSEAT